MTTRLAVWSRPPWRSPVLQRNHRPGGLYRPRNPRASPLYQCVTRHRDELVTAGLITRPVKTEVLERFLDCGDLKMFDKLVALAGGLIKRLAKKDMVSGGAPTR